MADRPAPDSNGPERSRWNDDRWTRSWPAREHLTSAVTSFLVQRAAPVRGERILDIGCGGGLSALAAAARVGPDGLVVGVDVSEALLATAEHRLSSSGLTNVSFLRLDAQTASLGGSESKPFDAAISQFGVMFFGDPVAAFANIARHLRWRGRLVFCCWQAPDRNPWHIATSLRPYVVAAAGTAPPATTVASDSTAPGPFSLSDWALTQRILGAAGFGAVERIEHEITVEAPGRAAFDPGLLGFYGVRPEDEGAAARAVDQHLQRFHHRGDTYRFPLAFRLVTAVTGGV